MARAFGYLSGGYAKHLEDDMLKVPRFFCAYIFNISRYNGVIEKPLSE